MQKNKLFHMSCKNHAKNKLLHMSCKNHAKNKLFHMLQKPCKNHAKCGAYGAPTRRTLTVPRVLAIRAIVLYLTRQVNIHSPRVPCYMCYMCYISQGNPLNIHSSGFLANVLYVLYLTRQPTEHPLSRVPCYMCYMCFSGLYGTYTTDFRAYRIYSTYSTYSKELGEWMFSGLTCKI